MFWFFCANHFLGDLICDQILKTLATCSARFFWLQGSNKHSSPLKGNVALMVRKEGGRKWGNARGSKVLFEPCLVANLSKCSLWVFDRDATVESLSLLLLYFLQLLFSFPDSVNFIHTLRLTFSTEPHSRIFIDVGWLYKFMVQYEYVIFFRTEPVHDGFEWIPIVATIRCIPTGCDYANNGNAADCNGCYFRIEDRLSLEYPVGFHHLFAAAAATRSKSASLAAASSASPSSSASLLKVSSMNFVVGTVVAYA